MQCAKLLDLLIYKRFSMTFAKGGRITAKINKMVELLTCRRSALLENSLASDCEWYLYDIVRSIDIWVRDISTNFVRRRTPTKWHPFQLFFTGVSFAKKIWNLTLCIFSRYRKWIKYASLYWCFVVSVIHV